MTRSTSTLARTSLTRSLTIALASPLAVLAFSLCTAPAEAASPTGLWSCSARGRHGLLLAVLPNGRLSLEGTPTAYRVRGAALEVLYGGRWVRMPFSASGSGRTRKLTVTVPASGARFACKIIPGGREQTLRGQFCSWSGGSSYYGGTASSRTHRVTFDGRGRFSSNREATFSGPGTGYYRRGGDKRGFYRVVGNKVIVVLANGAAGIAHVHHRYANRITELKYNGKLYGGANCK